MKNTAYKFGQSLRAYTVNVYRYKTIGANVGISSGQRNLMKTYHNEAYNGGIT